MRVDKFIFFTVIAAWSFTSCNNQLDLESDGRITMDQVFSDRNKTMGYLNACYGFCPAPYMDRASVCDEAQDADYKTSGYRYSNWYSGAVKATDFASYSTDGNPWTSLYQGIRKCNVFLYNIGTSTAYATDEEKKGWAAQAHTLRALYYLQLIKRYGAVPIFNEPLKTDHDFSTDKKSTFSEVVAFILSDCEAALEAPETADGFPWEIYDNQFGIMTRAIPYAIMSEAITYAASPLFNDGTYSWKNATEINKEALFQCLTHGYQLFNETPTFNAAQNAYALYFITSSDDKRTVDKETIYQCGSQMSVWNYAGLPSSDNMTKAGPCPTQELVDSYEMANGEAPITGYSDDEHLVPIINTESGYDPENPYKGRDPRFYASIYYNGAVRYLDDPEGQKAECYVGGKDGITQANRTHTCTGYYQRKFNNWQSGLNNEVDGAIRLFRLAELYLNFAESAYHSHGNEIKITLHDGMTMSAKDAVNAVRARAGMPPFPSGMTNEDFEIKYRNERRIELAFEEHRFFDVRRWKILDKTNALVTGMQITKDDSGKFTYTRINFDKRNCCSEKWLLYPIDQSDVIKVIGTTGVNWQNPGW